MTPLAKRILKKQKLFKSKPCRIFQSYSDPDALVLFRGYGMSRIKPPKALTAEILNCRFKGTLDFRQL
jgi:hypothetical protein